MLVGGAAWETILSEIALVYNGYIGQGYGLSLYQPGVPYTVQLHIKHVYLTLITIIVLGVVVFLVEVVVVLLLLVNPKPMTAHIDRLHVVFEQPLLRHFGFRTLPHEDGPVRDIEQPL